MIRDHPVIARVFFIVPELDGSFIVAYGRVDGNDLISSGRRCAQTQSVPEEWKTTRPELSSQMCGDERRNIPVAICADCAMAGRDATKSNLLHSEESRVYKRANAGGQNGNSG